MEDRELLELVAKAATDDGDALRLAVKLEIRVSVSGMKAIADWWQRPAMTELDCEVVAIDGDPCAALRRAIVLAATEIIGDK